MANAFSDHRADWLDKRIPPGKSITLAQRQIFILPSKWGIVSIALLVLLFVLAVNFQNSLVYLVCFWLLSLLTINILHTYRNLAGLHLQLLDISPAFAGEHCTITISGERAEHTRKFAIELHYPGQDTVELNLDSNQKTEVKLRYQVDKRGRFHPPRLTVRTVYPTGMAVAWTYIHLTGEGIVYPKPEAPKGVVLNSGGETGEEGGEEVQNGSEDFGGIRDYQLGDTSRHIHWSKFAQTGQLYSKSFVDYQTEALWLDWKQIPLPDTEARLSFLAQKILEYTQTQQSFGLKMPSTTVPVNTGESHQHHCLRVLALHGLES